jgi:hypothetical protein
MEKKKKERIKISRIHEVKKKINGIESTIGYSNKGTDKGRVMDH